jgi:electron transfer flavoprotein beta subunit
MGPEPAAEALRRALAMGGDSGVLVTDPALAGADEWVTARVLAAALDRLAADVSLMGMASDDARGSLGPGAVAAIRGLPLLSYGSGCVSKGRSFHAQRRRVDILEHRCRSLPP